MDQPNSGQITPSCHILRNGAKRIRTGYWKQCLWNASGFGETKSVLEDWRADEPAFDPDPNDVAIPVRLITAIEHGDMLLIEYLLEQGILPDALAAIESPEEKGLRSWNFSTIMGWT